MSGREIVIGEITHGLQPSPDMPRGFDAGAEFGMLHPYPSKLGSSTDPFFRSAAPGAEYNLFETFHPVDGEFTDRAGKGDLTVEDKFR